MVNYVGAMAVSTLVYIYTLYKETFFYFAAVILLSAILFVFETTSAAEEDAEETTNGDVAECITCGLPMMDPILDGESFSLNETDLVGKMYNGTCGKYEIMMEHQPQTKPKWIRRCPAGVKNCFWAQAEYGKQSQL